MNPAALRIALSKRAKRPGPIGALIAQAALKVAPQAGGDLEVQLWGRPVRLPANHHLPFIVGRNPFWSMPLVHSAAALSDRKHSKLTVVDVGANVGDSVVMLESYLPGRCEFLCLEPNAEWLPYLTSNTSGLPVEIIARFIGEGQLLEVNSSAPGTAGSKVTATGEQSVPLDEICNGRTIDLIKVDTDGFDFPILRSGREMLSSQKPALFFEWDPITWSAQGEDPEAIFPWLSALGYHDFCFFADGGFLYCRTVSNQPETIRSLIAAARARRGVDNLYWDVLAASPEVCDGAIQHNLEGSRKLSTEIRFWNRLQPTYWQ
jgi:FkbM family methyltransferase